MEVLEVSGDTRFHCLWAFLDWFVQAANHHLHNMVDAMKTSGTDPQLHQELTGGEGPLTSNGPKN